jgi:hypothetical protein
MRIQKHCTLMRQDRITFISWKDPGLKELIGALQLSVLLLYLSVQPLKIHHSYISLKNVLGIISETKVDGESDFNYVCQTNSRTFPVLIVLKNVKSRRVFS